MFGCCTCGVQYVDVEEEQPNIIDLFDQPRIRDLVLEYLEFEDIIDLRCICFRASELIDSPPVPPNESKPDFKTLLSQSPIIEDFQNADVINKLFMNEIFGGSVFNPV